MGCCEKKKPNDDNLLGDNYDKTQNYSITEDSTIKVKSQEDYTKMENVEKKLSYDDFEPLKLLGTGSFGRVLLVKKKNNNKLFAMKILLKSYLKKKTSGRTYKNRKKFNGINKLSICNEYKICFSR